MKISWKRIIKLKNSQQETAKRLEKVNCKISIMFDFDEK